MRKARPRKFGHFVAQNLTVRALRAAGLSRVLKGQTAVIGFLYPASFPVEWLVESSDILLRYATAKPHLCIEFASRARRRSRDSKRAELANALAENDVVFGFATDIQQFPDAFRLTADCIVSLEPIDRRAIGLAFKVVLGTVPSMDDLDVAARVPPSLLGAVFRPGRTPKTIIDIVRRNASSNAVDKTCTTSKLDAYSGFGEAAEWGKALAADLADYGAGRISWSDVDHGALISGLAALPEQERPCLCRFWLRPVAFRCFRTRLHDGRPKAI
jgi:hypothetical protein